MDRDTDKKQLKNKMNLLLRNGNACFLKVVQVNFEKKYFLNHFQPICKCRRLAKCNCRIFLVIEYFLSVMFIYQNVLHSEAFFKR